MKTLVGLLARVGKLEHPYHKATRPTAADVGLAALLAGAPRRPRDAEQERADEEILTRYEAGLTEPPAGSGLRRLLFEARLEKLRTRLLDDQAGHDSDAPSGV